MTVTKNNQNPIHKHYLNPFHCLPSFLSTEHRICKITDKNKKRLNFNCQLQFKKNFLSPQKKGKRHHKRTDDLGCQVVKELRDLEKQWAQKRMGCKVSNAAKHI